MNERIEQLANEVGISVEYLTNTKQWPLIEALAELIIKDCIGVIRTRYMGDNNREDVEVLKCIDLLKQHYGIE